MWNTDNVSNISVIFSECYSLSSLPDIYMWNTDNASNMKKIFYNCYSLSTSSLPYISQWKLKISKSSYKCMFEGCIQNLKYPKLLSSDESSSEDDIARKIFSDESEDYSF